MFKAAVLILTLSYFGGRNVALGLILIFAITKLLKYFVKRNRRTVDRDNEIDIRGKVVIVTGASAGIGKATAFALAERDANVILACRDVAKANLVVDDIRKRTHKGTLTVMELDLASLESVRNFAKEFKRKYPKLDILINNAGIGNQPGVKRVTEDGFEEHFGVNHLGHFLLTKLLLDELKNATPSRIVIVSSGAHMFGKLNFDDIMHHKSEPYSTPFPFNFIAGLYCNSKLANNLFNLELSKRLKGTGINTYALCPGIVATDIGKSGVKGVALFFRSMALNGFWVKTLEEGADTIIYCALSKNVSNHSGEMYRNCEFWDACRRPKLNEDDASRLWELSEKLVGL